MIDLHTHTNASDGLLSLEELVLQAEKAGLKALAITDHDTIQNAKRIPEIQPSTSIELIPGIEISVYDNKLEYIDLHVVGLFLDTTNKDLISTLEVLEKQREEQKKRIIEKLNQLGYAITYEQARAKAKGSFGRPHIAKVLIETYPDEFPTIADVFDKLLDQGKPGFMDRTAFFRLDQAIDLIHNANGVAILAHPDVYKYHKDKLLKDFKRLGGDGIETIYDYANNYSRKGYSIENNQRIINELQQKAKELGFLESGGSDFHGPKKGAPLGSLNIPYEFLEKMKEPFA